MQLYKEKFLDKKLQYLGAKDSLTKRLEGSNLTAEQWVVLDSITPGIHCAELAALSGLIVPSLSRMIVTLESDGLIKTAPDKNDARHKKITLTNKGQKLLDKIQRGRRNEGEANFIQRANGQINFGWKQNAN
jgi:DNA-binding MarR family transcriptional regulator